ncbi:hypothetical protein AAH973_12720 [Enterococcus faecalis]
MKKLKQLWEIPVMKFLISIFAIVLCFYVGMKMIDIIFPFMGFEK